MRIDIHFDGAFNNNAKEFTPMGIGVAVFIDNEYQDELSKAIGVCKRDIFMSSNIAEWTGCVEAMKMASEFRTTLYKEAQINIWSDSQLITNQFNGQFVINKEEFKPYCKEARRFAQIAKIKQISWIPREKNKQADKLSKMGLQCTFSASYK